jgi:hypothetical protein
MQALANDSTKKYIRTPPYFYLKYPINGIGKIKKYILK